MFLPSRLCLVLTACVIAGVLRADPTERNLQTVRGMLRPVWEEIRKEHFDLHGVGDTRALQQEAETRLATATSVAEALSIIAQSVYNLGDSHTVFLAPPRPFDVHYGWSLDIAGQKVVVGGIEPGSDAEKQGIRVGEHVLGINGMPASRGTLALLRYSLLALNPQPGLRVQLQWHDGSRREVAFAARLISKPLTLTLHNGRDNQSLDLESEAQRMKRRSAFQELGPGVLWWKLATFSEPDHLEKGLRKSTGYEHVILDLRGNPGGLESEMLDAIGAFFPDKLTVGSLRSRHKTKPLEASSRHTVRGKLLVLIDGGSASSAEVFARTMQLTGRGVVLGDRSAGKVNRGRIHTLSTGPRDQLIVFGVMITESGLMMADGQPLEKIGVEPEVWLV
ncbi:MAG: S41 family peptidase, partial [Candidatus Didemnitutus sp.]|nr:S41 family peptidase [Candidatus Didemnitutus sp.]